MPSAPPSFPTIRIGLSLWWVHLLAAMAGLCAIIIFVSGIFNGRFLTASLYALAMIAGGALLWTIGRYVPPRIRPMLFLTPTHLHFPNAQPHLSIPWTALARAEAVNNVLYAHHTVPHLALQLAPHAPDDLVQRIRTIWNPQKHFPDYANQFDILLRADLWDHSTPAIAAEINQRIAATQPTS